MKLQWICWSEKGDHKVLWKFCFLRRRGNLGEAVEQEEKLCNEVETVREFAYLGDRVSTSGGCEASVTSRTRFGWVNFQNLASYFLWALEFEVDGQGNGG